MKTHSHLRLPFPRQHRFAVIQIDPVEMVRQLNLDDKEALSEARSLRTQKYLVYLEFPQDLPGPKSPWCRFTILPVATRLRPDEPWRGVAPDMVMPISPNTRYAKGRTPIAPESPFPYDNCFFWIESRMTVRVKICPDGYDESNAVALSPRQWCALTKAWVVELERIDRLRNSFEAERSLTDPAHMQPATLDGLSVADRLHSPSRSQPSLPTTGSSGGPYGVSNTIDAEHANPKACSPEVVASVQALFSLNLFGWEPDPTFDLLPLVNVWFDLDTHLTAANIPDPSELKHEEASIRSIITKALERKAAAVSAMEAGAPLSTHSRGDKKDRYGIMMPLSLEDITESEDHEDRRDHTLRDSAS